MNTHSLVNSCNSPVTQVKQNKSKRFCQQLDPTTIDAALSIFQKDPSSQDSPSSLLNKKVQLIELGNESPSEEESSIDSKKPPIPPTPNKPLPPPPLSTQVPLTRGRAFSDPKPLPSLFSNSKERDFDSSKPRSQVLLDFTSSKLPEEAKSKSPFPLRFKKERKNSPPLEEQSHSEIEQDSKAKKSSPFIPEKSETKRRAFSFGRKPEKSQGEAVSPEAHVEVIPLEVVESQLMGKLISIPLIPYDSRYLDKIQHPEDIKLGLESTQNFSLTFFSGKILQKKELIEAIDKAKSTSPTNTFVDCLEKFFADFTSNPNILIKSLRYCDQKADSALRRVFSVNKGIYLCAYSSTANKDFFKKLHVEILENGFKVSRTCQADVQWMYNQNQKQTTSIEVEYIINNDLRYDNDRHYAKIAKINWKQQTTEEEKRAFLEILEKLFPT
jgi:hypothetical protein